MLYVESNWIINFNLKHNIRSSMGQLLSKFFEIEVQALSEPKLGVYNSVHGVETLWIETQNIAVLRGEERGAKIPIVGCDLEEVVMVLAM